jgi:glycosyltransferase involved in cell wall biosynthesis
MKKIKISLIADNRSDLLYDILKDLDKDKYEIFEFTGKNKTGVFQAYGQKSSIKLENKVSEYLSLIFYLFIFIYNIAKLTKIKVKKSINLILIASYPEKIFLTPAAKLLKIKILWVENPGEHSSFKKRPLLFLYKFFSKRTGIITFTAQEAAILTACNIKQENLETITPGIRISNYLRQEKIFSRLADTEDNKFNKFFTIGTSLDLSSKHKIELLFSAIKKSSTVIPQIQLIVIGDGKERKNLSWIAKKMGIDGLVWFVGEQAFFRKWADSFDLYAVACDHFTAGDINPMLQAMAAGLPVISTPIPILDEFVCHLNNGLITDTEDSESLAQAIIKLHQNAELRKKLGCEGKSLVDNTYNLDRMVKQFENIIKKDAKI